MGRSPSLPIPEVVRHLGGGGMADVYLVRLPSGELAALKRLRPQLAADAEFVHQLEREARIGSLLVHENIVGFKGVGIDTLGPHLVLEYIEGMSASALLSTWTARKRTHLPIEAVLSVLADMVDGLSYAHALKTDGIEGVIHRDISPDNVLITLEGCAKLSDFGIAKFLGTTRTTRTGTLKGKFGYLAPELFDSNEASPLSDVFSLGATAFRLLAGVSAFQGESEAQLVRAVLHGSPPRLLSLRDDVPREVADWVDQSLSKKPADRPSLSDLSGALVGVREEGRPQLSSAVRAMYQSQLPSTPIRSQRRTVALAAPRWRTSRGVAVTLAVSLAGLAAFWALRPAREVSPSFDSQPPVVTPSAATAPSDVPEALAPAEPEMPQVPGPAAVEPQTVRKAVPTALPPRAVKKPKTVRRITPPAERQPPPKALPSTGKLRIKVRPWGEVFVDGTLRGVAPPMPPFDLPTGMHSVIVVNQQLKKKLSYQVEVLAGQETELKAVLDEVNSSSP